MIEHFRGLTSDPEKRQRLAATGFLIFGLGLGVTAVAEAAMDGPEKFTQSPSGIAADVGDAIETGPAGVVADFIPDGDIVENTYNTAANSLVLGGGFAIATAAIAAEIAASRRQPTENSQ
jgi:hypothetical protein